MKQYLPKALAISALALVAILVGSWMNSRHVHADDDDDRDSRIKKGFRIAPVPLNFNHRDRELVGYGSYLVNAVADCNGCHSAGPATEYLPGGNPYFGNQPERINPATYLGGGNDFGPLIPGSAHIISRNLTPDKTGKPEGGNTFQEFREIMRRGVDLDHLHPTCADPKSPNPGCIPAPFDGSLLQIMPWPVFRHQSEEDLRAIYEYLSAIPCIAGPPAPDPLHHDCR